MKNFLLVALGGGLGAVCRYAISLIPFPSRFPVATLLANLLGAVIIGFLVGTMGCIPSFPKEANLLLKTGFCGGFTTFSTFSLESIQLLQEHHYVLGSLYILISLVVCLAGVILGQAAARLCFPS